MLSRVARHLYWLGRYIERAENTARLINVYTDLMLDLPKENLNDWSSLLDITGTESLFREYHRDANERSILTFLLQGQHHPCALLPGLLAARENCRAARDCVPLDTWEQLNSLFLFAKEELNTGLTKKGRHFYLQRIISGLQSIFGLLYGSLSRDAGFHFIQMGCFLERADMTSRFVSASYVSSDFDEDDHALGQHIHWMNVLKSLSAYQMYQKNMQVRVRRVDVLYFLLKHPQFPRSIYFSLQELSHHIQSFGNQQNDIEHHLRSISQWIAQLNCTSLGHKPLCQAMNRLQHRLADVHSNLEEAYFSQKLPVSETPSRSM